MITIEKMMEMRGMKRSEIINYFISINGENAGAGRFIGRNWQVEVFEENLVAIGSFKIPATKVIFRGEKELLEQMIAAFRLKFLSAGG